MRQGAGGFQDRVSGLLCNCGAGFILRPVSTGYAQSYLEPPARDLSLAAQYDPPVSQGLQRGDGPIES